MRIVAYVFGVWFLACAALATASASAACLQQRDQYGPTMCAIMEDSTAKLTATLNGQIAAQERQAAWLRANSPNYRAALQSAERLIRGAGFVCSEAVKIMHVDLGPPATGIVCESGRAGKRYLFHVRDVGGRALVIAVP